MKRLIRISLDIFLMSFMPILSWFLLGILVEPSLINVFVLTYPIQFIALILKSIFGVGSNIYAYKEENKNAINTGIVLGMIFGLLIFGLIILNMDSYINYMNMDISKYKVFGIYVMIYTFLQLVLQLILEKLYYKDKNKLANKYSIIFNLISLISLVILSLITKNQIIIASYSLLLLLMFTIYIFIINIEKFKFSIDILKCIKYDSIDFFSYLLMFIMYIFGVSNTISYGEEYAAALSFALLITDVQWDVITSIGTVAKIDITKGNFVYKNHLFNGFKLASILVVSVFILYLLLNESYNVSAYIVFLYILVDIIGLILYPIYRVRTIYVQLEYSAVKATTNKSIAYIIRVIFSFLPTPFCTQIGQFLGMIYQYIFSSILFKKAKSLK